MNTFHIVFLLVCVLAIVFGRNSGCLHHPINGRLFNYCVRWLAAFSIAVGNVRIKLADR